MGAELGQPLDDVPGIVWTPASTPAPAPLILVGHPGGLPDLYPRVAGRARYYAAEHGFSAATIELPGKGERPRIPAAEQARAELADPRRLRAQIDTFIAERERFASLLRDCPAIERVYADAGFVTVRADTALGAHLARAGFDTVPRPMGWPDCIRISIGTPEINDRVIAALRTYRPQELST